MRAIDIEKESTPLQASQLKKEAEENAARNKSSLQVRLVTQKFLNKDNNNNNNKHNNNANANDTIRKVDNRTSQKSTAHHHINSKDGVKDNQRSIDQRIGANFDYTVRSSKQANFSQENLTGSNGIEQRLPHIEIDDHLVRSDGQLIRRVKINAHLITAGDIMDSSGMATEDISEKVVIKIF